MKQAFSVLLILCLLLISGCGENAQGNTANTSGTSTSSGSVDSATGSSPVPSYQEADMFTDRDSRTEYDTASAITIALSGSTATASDSSVIIADGVITITGDGVYLLSGTLSEGMVIVDAPDTAKLQLVLNGASITSNTSAPIYIKNADKVFVTLVGANTLCSGDSFTAIDDSNIDGAVFSKEDLTFNGEGSLTISSPVGHGIVCKDDLVFTGGSYTITSASHGIQANDSVRIQNTTLSINAGKDGIHAENTEDTSKGFIYIHSGDLNIDSQGDGISAGTDMQITGGTVNILAGGGYENGTKEHSDSYGQFGGGMPGGRPGGMSPGGRSMENTSLTDTSQDSSSSMKGLKSGSSILLSGGTFVIDSADDAIHANSSATISGGTFTIASGDDAIHAEDTLTVTDGTFDITNSYEGLEALHISVSGGDIRLKATDDGLNAAGGTDQSGTGGRDDLFGGRGMGMSGNSSGSITISGGTLYIHASGDGIDANGTLEITGGHTTVIGPTQGDTATLDYDKTATIAGGTFIGTGASTMAQTFSSSKQGVIALSVGSQTANTQITLTDQSGNVLISYAPELSFQIVILSTPQMHSGETYTVTVGTESGEFEAN